MLRPEDFELCIPSSSYIPPTHSDAPWAWGGYSLIYLGTSTLPLPTLGTLASPRFLQGKSDRAPISNNQSQCLGFDVYTAIVGKMFPGRGKWLKGASYNCIKSTIVSELQVYF